MENFDTPMSSSWEPSWHEDAMQPLFHSPADIGRLGSKYAHEHKVRLGHDLWYERDQIRDELARGGKGLLIGLIASLIARSGGNMISLSSEIAALGGDHLYCLVQDVIREFEGTDPECHLWYKSAPGTYVLTA